MEEDHYRGKMGTVEAARKNKELKALVVKEKPCGIVRDRKVPNRRK